MENCNDSTYQTGLLFICFSDAKPFVDYHFYEADILALTMVRKVDEQTQTTLFHTKPLPMLL